MLQHVLGGGEGVCNPELGGRICATELEGSVQLRIIALSFSMVASSLAANAVLSSSSLAAAAALHSSSLAAAAALHSFMCSVSASISRLTSASVVTSFLLGVSCCWRACWHALLKVLGLNWLGSSGVLVFGLSFFFHVGLLGLWFPG